MRYETFFLVLFADYIAFNLNAEDWDDDGIREYSDGSTVKR